MNWNHCSKCDRWKPKDCFRKTQQGNGGYCKECYVEYNSKYYKDNRNKILRCNKEYDKEHYRNNKVKRLIRTKQYYAEHKEEIKKYPSNSKEARRKYRQTPKVKERDRLEHYKRRKLGFIALNKPFPKSAGHHINDMEVVYILNEIHKRFGHIYPEIHRKRVLEFYGSLENMINNIIPNNNLMYNNKIMRKLLKC